jgi:hypothetical protein
MKATILTLMLLVSGSAFAMEKGKEALGKTTQIAADLKNDYVKEVKTLHTTLTTYFETVKGKVMNPRDTIGEVRDLSYDVAKKAGYVFATAYLLDQLLNLKK